MDYDINWLEEIGLDTKSGLSYTNGTDKYIAAIQRYIKSYDKNKELIESGYNSKDYESFMITVHALKSNSRMIGATVLGQSFEALELAAKEGDEATIEALTTPTLGSYDKLIKELQPIAEMEEVHTADEIDADTARATVVSLLEALDDFDDELSLELAKKLMGYPFRITQQDKLKEAIALIEDFSYDEAADIIREIEPTIE